MLFFRLLNFLAGYRLLSCSAKDAVAVMNLLHECDFDYWNAIRGKGGELSFCLLEKELRRFRTLAVGISFRTVKRKGLPSILNRYRKRIGVAIGMLIFLLLTELSTRYVWEVTVMGNETLTDAEVMECLENLGCGVGTYIPSVDFYELCHRFLLEKEEVSWISVNMVGTTARVELIESDAKGSMENGGNGTPSNLVASQDGIVVRTETASGKLSVRAGETVSRGQLLVSGVVDVGREEDGRFVLVRSRAAIYAQTERTLEVVVPYQTVKKTKIGWETVKKSLKFFGKTIKLKENSSILPEECDIIEEKRRIVLFDGDAFTGGIPLPIVMITEGYDLYREETVTLTEDEAKTVAGISMAELFIRELGDAEILSRTVSYSNRDAEDGNSLVLVWKMTCIENIAKEAPIGIS